MKSGTWSIEGWCTTQQPSSYDDLILDNQEAEGSVIAFFERLNLTFVHPFCNISSTMYRPYNLPDVPAQGPLLNHDHLETWYDVLVTIVAMVAPSMKAMIELWVRLFSSIIAPIALLCMIYFELKHASGPAAISIHEIRFLSFACCIGVACSVVLLTDSLYVYEYGPMYGGTVLGLSVTLSLSLCSRYSLRRTRYAIFGTLVILIALVYDYQLGSINFGDPKDIPKSIDEGLYYNKLNQRATQIVKEWPKSYRAYSPVSTPWLPTGDSRTGIPFLVNSVRPPNWVRVWLPLTDGEVLALDFAFPKRGFDAHQPVYLVLHGLNGGSNEEYVKDFTIRRTEQEGATIVVMIARGLMDLPIRGMNVFHGARWEDPHQAALAIRRAILPGQIFAGVGYSMGAIILGNMVSRTGAECALDVAVAISGGLDTRFELDVPRAHRLWQPLLIKQLRDNFAIGKWGERVRHRLTKTQMKALMRTTHVSGFDRYAVVAYHGYRDLVHYYSEMSALGDVPFPSDEYNGTVLPPTRRIHHVSIPFCVVHALDDPLVTWRTVAATSGLMHPQNLTSLTGSGNLFLLLTKRGGHVGWPTGWLPNIDGWKWMSDISMSFVMAVSKVREKNRLKEETNL